MTTKYWSCLELATMCGFSLYRGIIIVSIATKVIAAISLGSSLASLRHMTQKNVTCYNKPIEAVNFIFSMYCISISTYQFLISALLLWKALKKQVDVFTCTLWYVSHLSIIILYGIFFIVRAIACFSEKAYLQGAWTVIAGILYIGVFIYFCIIVNCYAYTIDQPVYY